MIVWVWGAVVLLVTLFGRSEEGAFALSVYGVRPFGFLLKWLLALQACRFFVEARRSGALEMLLCTPLTSRDIIRGQALALRKSFLWPVVSLLALQVVPSWFKSPLSHPGLLCKRELRSLGFLPAAFTACA